MGAPEFCDNAETSQAVSLFTGAPSVGSDATSTVKHHARCQLFRSAISTLKQSAVGNTEKEAGVESEKLVAARLRNLNHP